MFTLMKQHFSVHTINLVLKARFLFKLHVWPQTEGAYEETYLLIFQWLCRGSLAAAVAAGILLHYFSACGGSGFGRRQ